VPFYPLAFYPPDEYEELLDAWETRPIWILKAPALSRGRAIRVVRAADERPPMLPYVVEEYIPRPLLVTGWKFDVRLYALVTSVSPLVIYFHPGGLCLFATSPYGTDGDLTDLTAHVTNYQINKTSKNFVVCEGLDERVENSKGPLHSSGGTSRSKASTGGRQRRMWRTLHSQQSSPACARSAMPTRRRLRGNSGDRRLSCSA
jgi:hypothetical protein